MSGKRLLIRKINKAMLAIIKQHADGVGEQGHLPFTETKLRDTVVSASYVMS